MLRITLAFLALACSLNARVYFVNRGVKYHVGDNHYDLSEDKEFVGTYPVVGQEWIQAFKVSQADTVKVSIANVWGVDDCPYCKVIVGIDDHDMGRLTQANNHEPFNTLQPLAMSVEPGKTYLVKVVSYGDGKVDDFVIEGVSVETEKAEVTFLRPGPILKMPADPMPVFSEAPQAPVPGPCPNLHKLEDWELGAGKARDSIELSTAAADFASSGMLGLLHPGESVEIFVQSRAAGGADKVSRAIEVLCGGKDDSGWVLTLDDAGRAVHGNLRRHGSYRSARFDERAFQALAWNRLRLSYCLDGSLRLEINDSALSAGFPGGGKPLEFSVRSLGQKTTLSGSQKFR